MQTSMSLTFFTAIFVAFSAVLAEELMIFCRHVRTELYRLVIKVFLGPTTFHQGLQLFEVVGPDVQ